MKKPYKFEFSKTSFDELPKEEQLAIETLCSLIAHNSSFELLFSFLINEHISECILEDIEHIKNWIEVDKSKQIVWFQKIVSIMEFIQSTASLQKEVANFEKEHK